jgi:hypothetical protein
MDGQVADMLRTGNSNIRKNDRRGKR